MDLIANNMRQVPSDYWHLISISCPDTPKKINALINERTRGVLKTQRCDKILPLQFDDLRDDQVERCLKHGFTPTLFTKEQSVQVIDFVEAIHKDNRVCDLVLHCDAGISRSGAIARFTSDYLKIPFRDPNILPNRYVLELLWEVIDDRKKEIIIPQG